MGTGARRTAAAALIALVTLAASPVGASARHSAATPESGAHEVQLTPVIQAVAEPPHWFEGDDGKVHLQYELLVTNTIPLSPAGEKCGKIKVMSVARLLGQAIRSIHEETSVSSLFV